MDKILQKVNFPVVSVAKGLALLTAIFFLSSQTVSAQYYRTKGSGGDWSSLSTWQVSATADGVYVDLTAVDPIPTADNSTQVLIQNEHAITVSSNGDVAVDQLIIEGTLSINQGSYLTIMDDPGATNADLIVTGYLVNDGYFILDTEKGTATAEISGTLTSKTGKYSTNTGNFTFKASSIYNHTALTFEYPLPLATWHVSSTINITGLQKTTIFSGTSLPNSNQEFGHFIWDTPYLESTGEISMNPSQIKGNFTIKSTGLNSRPLLLNNNLQVGGNLSIDGPGYVRLSSGGTTAKTVTINGKVKVAGGTLDFISGTTGTSTLDVKGDFEYAAPGIITKTAGSVANINFSGVNQTATVTKEFVGDFNFKVDNKASLNLSETSFIATTVPASSSFTVSANSTVNIGDADGINTTSGNIRIPQTFTAGSKIVYNGTAAQVIGTSFPASADINLEIKNAAGVTMKQDLTIAAGRTLTLTSGNLNIEGYTLTLNGNVAGTGGGLGTLFTSNLNIGGTGALGALRFTAGVPVLNNLTINRTNSGTVTLSTPVGIVGKLQLDEGSFIVHNNLLGLYGTADFTNGALSGNANTVLLVGVIPEQNLGLPSSFLQPTGTINLNFSQDGNTINTLTLGALATTVNLKSNLTIAGSLFLERGSLNRTGSEIVTLGDNSTIYRTNGTLNFKPTAASSRGYNLFYYGATATPGNEFTETASIQNLTIGGAGNASAFTLSGARTIQGNLTVANGSFTGADGSTIKMSGNAPQTISGNATFHDLNIANTNGGVSINNTIPVNNTLTFTSGNLQTGANQVQLGSTGSVAGETDNNRLIGNIQITKTPAVGVKETFGNLGIEMTPNGTSPGSIVVNRNTGTPITASVGTPSIARVFDINGPVDGQNIALTLKYLDAELNGNSEGALRMYKSSSPNIWKEQGVEDPTRYSYADNAVTLSGVTGFSKWTLAAPSVTLPVELTYFTAKKKGKVVELNWETAMETDNQGFAIQVSTDAVNYRQIGFVTSKNENSRYAQKYTFTDSERKQNGEMYYYRLKQVDNNGNHKFYGPEVVSFNAGMFSLKAAPNPFDQQFEVLFETTDKEAAIRVTDMMGKTIFSKQVITRRGVNTLKVDLENQPNGIYFLTIVSAGGKEQLKLIKK